LGEDGVKNGNVAVDPSFARPDLEVCSHEIESMEEAETRGRKGKEGQKATENRPG